MSYLRPVILTVLSSAIRGGSDYKKQNICSVLYWGQKCLQNDATAKAATTGAKNGGQKRVTHKKSNRTLTTKDNRQKNGYTLRNPNTSHNTKPTKAGTSPRTRHRNRNAHGSRRGDESLWRTQSQSSRKARKGGASGGGWVERRPPFPV